MHTERKSAPASLLLRLGGTLIGAILSAISAAILFFIAAALDFLSGIAAFQMFLGSLTVIGGCVGFAIPRWAIHSLWFFFPEICEHRSS